MKIQYKSFPFTIKEIKQDENKQYGIIKGYASTFGNIDKGRDKVLKGAFEASLKKYMSRKRQIPMYFQHNDTLVVGGFDMFAEDEKGLYVEGKINLGIQKGKEVYLLAKQGVLQDFSIGYYPKEYEINNEENTRDLMEIDLVEISMVTNPMNEMANLTDVKKNETFKNFPIADKDTKWDPNEAIERIKEFTFSEKCPSESYKNAFLYYDIENKNKFDSYKYPYVDVIDNELRVVPNAIFATSELLNEQKQNINDTDKQNIISHLEKYYDKLNMESPFEGSEYKSISDISKKLKAKGFSNKEANEIIYFMKKLSRNDDGSTSLNNNNEGNSLKSNEPSETPRNEGLDKLDSYMLERKLDKIIEKLRSTK